MSARREQWPRRSDYSSICITVLRIWDSVIFYDQNFVVILYHPHGYFSFINESEIMFLRLCGMEVVLGMIDYTE